MIDDFSGLSARARKSVALRGVQRHRDLSRLEPHDLPGAGVMRKREVCSFALHVGYPLRGARKYEHAPTEVQLERWPPKEPVTNEGRPETYRRLDRIEEKLDRLLARSDPLLSNNRHGLLSASDLEKTTNLMRRAGYISDDEYAAMNRGPVFNTHEFRPAPQVNIDGLAGDLATPGAPDPVSPEDEGL